MKFNSQICTTKEQSERLLALGLKKETADVFYSHDKGEDIYAIRACWEDFWSSNKLIDSHIRRSCIPAWSLHRLLCLFPTEYIYDTDYQQIMRDFVFGSSDMYDETISCIETLIEAGYFYDEYLEEKKNETILNTRADRQAD